MKFNFLRKENKVVLNYEGAKSYAMTPAEELYSAVVTTGLSDANYEKGNDRLERIRSLIKKMILNLWQNWRYMQGKICTCVPFLWY
ncbi:hypothetical protein OWR28_08505 [Chryseobacterium sp. 1B4]